MKEKEYRLRYAGGVVLVAIQVILAFILIYGGLVLYSANLTSFQHDIFIVRSNHLTHQHHNGHLNANGNFFMVSDFTNLYRGESFNSRIVIDRLSQGAVVEVLAICHILTLWAKCTELNRYSAIFF